MKVAVAQMQCALGDVEANGAQMADLARQAAREGCTAIVFPEISDVGYDAETIRERARTWKEKPFRTVQSAAKKNKVHILCGLAEREGKTIYNSIAVFDDTGALIGRYRKAHLFTPSPVNEDRCFTPGNRLEVVNIGGLKWGLFICYDLRFPEMARALALKGAEVLALPTAWPFPRVAHLEILLAARAIENQAYVVTANHVGTAGGVTFCGSSRIVDPYGVIVTAAAVDRAELLVGEIDPGKLKWARARMPIFRDRREDVYAEGKVLNR
ncbi:MAG: nitrilase-related carbon-nitrogen hydrolase [Verrucomicrobiota bacterium]